MKADTPPLLAVEGLAVSYDRLPVLHDIRLQVYERQIAALVGPEGAGKTTLLNVISGLIRPEQGRIRFAGEALENLPAWDIVRRGVIYVPEGSPVFPEMSVLENLEVGAYVHRAHLEARLELVFEVFPELRELRRTPAGVLSGGQQRLVALGRGLMAGPRLLLLDEPFLGLSPKLVRRFCDTFKTLLAQGLTLLIASQYAHRILQVADLAYLMEEGRITLSGAGPDILKDQHLHQVLFGPGL